VSNNAWITITAGSSGTGNGTVNYDVSANTGAARNGTITIADQTFTVAQAGCQYVVTPSVCCTGGRIYTNANVTGGTPASVAWSIDGASQGNLTFVSGTLWGGSRTGCTLTNAARSGTGYGAATHTVNVTSTGACQTGSVSVPVTCP
jgi:hypothetical protein